MQSNYPELYKQMSNSNSTPLPTRKPSLRQKLRDSFRPSSIRSYLDLQQKDGTSSKRTSLDIPEEGRWLGRKRRKNRQAKDEGVVKHSLGELKIDVGGLEDLKMSFDAGEGSEMYSLRSPGTFTTITSMGAETIRPETIRPEKAEEKIALADTVMKDAPPMELEDTSGMIAKSPALDPAATVQQPPEHIPILRKGPRYQIKMDNLVRPVSRATANPLSENISRTLETINRNSFNTGGKFSSPVDNISSARPSIESSRSKALAPTAMEKVDSVHGSNASVNTATARRPLADSSRTNNFAGNRHSVGDIDKMMGSKSTEQENKRQSFPPVAARRQSLMNINQNQRPKSPTGSITSMTSIRRPRAPSGSLTSQRLAWIKELEANGGTKTPGQEYMSKKLEGSVADKLRRFESHSSTGSGSATPALKRTYSNASRVSASGSDAYGIEVAGSRLSRNVTNDDEFRRKLEEKIEKKKREDEEKERRKMPQQVIDFVEAGDGDPEAKVNELMKDGKAEDVARDIDAQAKAALGEQDWKTKRQGRIYEHYPSAQQGIQVRGGPKKPEAVMQSAAAARTSDNIVPASAPVKKVEVRGGPQKILGVMQTAQKVEISKAPTKKPVVITKKPAPMPMSMDDDEYDPFNYASYPSRSSIYSNPPEPPKIAATSADAEKKEYGGHAEGEEPEVVGGPMKYMAPPEEVETVETDALNDDSENGSATDILQLRGGPEKIENVLEAAGVDMEAPLPSAIEKTKEERETTEKAAESAQTFQPRGRPEKISSILDNAGINTEAPLPSNVTEPKEAEEPVETSQPRGGPQKIANILQGANVNMEAPLPSSSNAAQQEDKKQEESKSPEILSPVPVRGSPRKPVAVMESAASARENTPVKSTTERKMSDPIKRKPVEIRGGPQKPAAVMESASTPEEPVKTVETKGGPQKPLAVMESAAAAQATTDEPMKPVEIRGGPQKPIAVMESAAAAPETAAPETTEEKKMPTTNEHTRPFELRGGPQKPMAVLESAGMVSSSPLKSSLPLRKLSSSTARKPTPSSLLLSNGSVKVASPCSSPTKSPTDFSAATLPRFGKA